MLEPTRLAPDLARPLSSPPRAAGSPPAPPAEAPPGPPQESFESAPSESVARVRVFPQDPLVGPTEEITLPKAILGTKLASERMEIRDRAPVAIADPEGHYLYPVDTPQFDQVNAYAIVANTVSMYDAYLGRPVRWSFSGPLKVLPHKGTGKTAYFSGRDGSINFFEWQSPSLGKRVTTAQSADVIAHEIGHAVWDGLRPRAGYSNEAGAFHEAFGDCSALLHSLQQDSNLRQALQQNGGDLRQPSLLSRMAEEFGTAFNKEDKDPKNDERPYYRTALNEFKYIDPRQLPDDDYPPTVGEEVLTREFHSFSRVWSGAFYRMLTSLYDGARAEGQDDLSALKQARDQLGQTWGQALHELPPSGIKFSVVGEAMLKVAARQEQKSVFDQLGAVLVDRAILTPERVAELRESRVEALTWGDGSAQGVLDGLSRHWGLSPDQEYREVAPPERLADGRTVYQFGRSEQHTWTASEGSGERLQVELDSGLSATFDAQGRLLSAFHTPVGPVERAEAELYSADLLSRGRLQESAFSLATHSPDGKLFLGQVLEEPSGVKRLQRHPIYD